MKKKILCVAASLIMMVSVVVPGQEKIIVPNTAIKTNATNNKVLKSSTFTIDKAAVKKITKFHKENTKLTKVEKYQKKIFNLGVVFSNSDEEFVRIKKDPKKNSKVVGYIPDEKPITVVEQVKTWYKVTSGKITGYVKQNNIIVDDVEDLLLDNQDMEAVITKSNLKIRGSAKDNDGAVGMAYKDSSYPVIGFSNNYKKVRIQRTETIAGWIPTKDVDIKILSNNAMTKAEYEAYQEEQERIRQAELQKILNAGISKTGNELFDTISALIAHNESGNYLAARNGLPQFKGEKTITVGAWQWYGERAHNLLRRIYNSDTKKSKKLIEESLSGSKKKKREKVEQLCKEITQNSSWENRKRSFSKEELVAVKALLGSDYGMAVQNLQAQEDISARINVAKSTYKLTNPQLIAYFCDMFWQNPDNARAITKAAIDYFKSAKKLNKEKDGLKVIHEIAMKNSVLGKFSGRRNYTYSICKKMSK